MFLQLDRVRSLLQRYLRRFVALLNGVDAFRLIQRLERRVPDELKGPATRAILHNAVVEIAGRHGVPVRI